MKPSVHKQLCVFHGQTFTPRGIDETGKMCCTILIRQLRCCRRVIASLALALESLLFHQSHATTTTKALAKGNQ